MLKEKITEIRELKIVEKILLILLLLFILFYLIVEYKYLNLLRVIFNIGIPAFLIFIILLRFSNENKAIISLISGVIGLSFLILNLFNRYTPLNIHFGLPIQITSVFGLVYGIVGLKSNNRNISIVGIILNILQFITLLIPRYSY